MAVTDTASTTVRLTRVLKAPPARVFTAWTTAEGLKRWSAPGDMIVASASTDLRVGGAYEITMRSPDGTEHRVGGVYKEIVTPERLVYTWRWMSKPGTPETVVVVEFRPHPAGTELVLVHEHADAEARDKHEHGWNGCLDKLAGLLG